MKVKLLREAKIAHAAGDIVEVSPAKGAFLISVGSAVEIADKAEKETVPEVEVAEKAVKAPKATTAKKPAVRKAVKK